MDGARPILKNLDEPMHEKVYVTGESLDPVDKINRRVSDMG